MAVRSVGSTSAMVYDWLVGTSFWLKNARRSQKRTATHAAGANTITTRNRLEGMCVKTIVLSSPMQRARRAATQRDTAVRTFELKKATPSSAGSSPNLVKNLYD